VFGKNLTYVDRLDAEHVLVALHQAGAGTVDQTLPHLTLTQGQDSTLLPHVHALLLHSTGHYRRGSGLVLLAVQGSSGLCLMGGMGGCRTRSFSSNVLESAISHGSG